MKNNDNNKVRTPIYRNISAVGARSVNNFFFSISDRNEFGNQLPWMKAQASTETTRLSRSVDSNINRYLKHEFEEKKNNKKPKT